MYLSKSVEVDVDIEIKVQDVLDFIKEAGTKDFNKIKERFQVSEFKASTLHGIYYQELLDKLIKSGKHPFDVERLLEQNNIL